MSLRPGRSSTRIGEVWIYAEPYDLVEDKALSDDYRGRDPETYQERARWAWRVPIDLDKLIERPPPKDPRDPKDPKEEDEETRFPPPPGGGEGGDEEEGDDKEDAEETPGEQERQGGEPAPCWIMDPEHAGIGGWITDAGGDGLELTAPAGTAQGLDDGFVRRDPIRLSEGFDGAGITKFGRVPTPESVPVHPDGTIHLEDPRTGNTVRLVPPDDRGGKAALAHQLGAPGIADMRPIGSPGGPADLWSWMSLAERSFNAVRAIVDGDGPRSSAGPATPHP